MAELGQLITTVQIKQIAAHLAIQQSPAALTVIHAPTGYNKTTLAQSLYPEKSKGVLWLSPAYNNSDSLLRQIRNQTAKTATPLTVVIDDYHLLTHPQLDVDLARLSAEIPLLSLVIIGRNVGILGGPLAAALTSVRVVDKGVLAVPVAALTETLSSIQSFETSLSSTEGWPLAVRAALAGLEEPTRQPPIDLEQNLHNFALNQLEILGQAERAVLLSAAQVDGIGLGLAAQIAQIEQISVEDAAATAKTLEEQGLLVAVPWRSGVDYRCHESVRKTLRKRGSETFSSAQRAQLFISRAQEVQSTAPYTAFRLYCAGADFEAAETVLARNFTTITDEDEVPYHLLQELSESVMVEYPTLAGARLFLERQRMNAGPATLERLRDVWVAGLQARLPKGAASTPGPLHLPLLMQVVASGRLHGRMDNAMSALRHLESQLAKGTTAGTAVFGALPHYYWEGALTALMAGDFGWARRLLTALAEHSEDLISRPVAPMAPSVSRVVTDAQAGTRWKLAELALRAFLEMIEGDMTASAAALREYDTLESRSGQAAPGLSWVNAEMTRAQFESEGLGWRVVRSDLEPSVKRPSLGDIPERVELWQIFAVTDSVGVLRTRGPGTALVHLRGLLSDGETARKSLALAVQPEAPEGPQDSSDIVDTSAAAAGDGARGSSAVAAGSPSRGDSAMAGVAPSRSNPAGGSVAPSSEKSSSNVNRPVSLVRQPLFTRAFDVRLCVMLGRFSEAERLLAEAPRGAVMDVERARLALFEGDDVRALALTRGIADPGTTVRQRVERDLIASVAAWGCGMREEASRWLKEVIGVARDRGLEAILSGVPYDILMEMGREIDSEGAGLGMVQLVEGIAEPARVFRYERLTPMELKSLRAVAALGSNADAGEALGVGAGTVKKHLAAVYRKLGVNSREAAVLQATAMGLVEV